MLQCFDNEALSSCCKGKVLGGDAPHSAFDDPIIPESTPHRIPIEVQALIFFIK